MDSMRMLKKGLKIMGVIVAVPAVAIALYLGSAFFLSRLATPLEQADNKEIAVYILTNGVHTDLVLPVKTETMDWSEQIRFEHTKGKDTTAQYVAFGWGDKGFYLETPTWGDLKFKTAFNAAFSLSTSAIHATFYKRMREGDDCRKIMVNKEQYQRLVTYILSTLRREGDRAIVISTNANYGSNDAFYEAVGSYSVFHTCNTWANNGLKSCGQKACWWTPFDSGIFYQYTK